MQIKVVKNIAAGVVLLGGLAAISNCGNNSRTLKNICKENGYTKTELKDVLKNTENSDKEVQAANRQGVIDSIAYRALFNSTEFADNQYALDMFVKTSQSLSPESNSAELKNDFINAVADEGADISELKSLEQSLKKDSNKWLTSRKTGAYYRYKFDKYLYEKLFQKLGLTENKQFKDKFENISKKIEP